MPKETVNTSAAPAAIGPYSQAVRCGKFLFLSGQIPIDPVTCELVTGSIEDQTNRVILNIKEILSSVGLSLNSVVKTTIFLTDLADFAAVNNIYGSYFEIDPPARSTIQVAGLPKGANVEIEVIAAAYG